MHWPKERPRDGRLELLKIVFDLTIVYQVIATLEIRVPKEDIAIAKY
jgi:hypothetical protein